MLGVDYTGGMMRAAVSEITLTDTITSRPTINCSLLSISIAVTVTSRHSAVRTATVVTWSKFTSVREADWKIIFIYIMGYSIKC